MAVVTVTKTVCDIFGTAKDLKRMRLTLEVADGIDLKGEEPERWKQVNQVVKILGKRGRERLDHFMTKGTTKPTARDGD
jgi:hypothetical protein